MKIEEKDTKPLLVGIAMLLVSAIVGYSLGFTNGQAEIMADASQYSQQLTTPQPTTPVEEEQDTLTAAPIPSTWQTYDTFFGVAQYTFQYPPSHVVSDTNVRNGQLYLFPQDNFSFPASVVIDSVNRTFYFQEYESGPVEDWFRENIQIVYPDSDFSALAMDSVTFEDGSSYLTVSNWPENTQQINPNLFNGTWYINVDGPVSYYLVDNGELSNEDVVRILSSLRVTQPQ